MAPGRKLTAKEQEYIERNLDRAADLLTSGRYEKAVAACVANRDWLLRSGATGPRVDAYLGHTHQVQAVCCAETGALDEAIDQYGRAEEVLVRHAENHETLVRCMHDLAVLLVDNGADSVAVEVLQRARKLAAGVPGRYHRDITEFLDALISLDSSVPGESSLDIQDTAAELRARVARAKDPADAATDLANLAGILLEHGGEEDFAEGQAALLRGLSWYRTNRHWDKYVGGLGMLRAVLQRPITLTDPILHEVAEAVRACPQLPSLSLQADVCEAAAAVTFTQASVAPLKERTIPLALRAIAYKDAVASQMRSTLVRGLQGANSGEIACRIALTAAADAGDEGLFVELLESGRLQVLPVARAGGRGAGGAPNLAREVATAGAVELSRIHPLSTTDDSRLRPYYPAGTTMPADLSLFETIAAVGGPAAWWWGATVIDGRYFWAVVDPTLRISMGYRDLDQAALDLLKAAAMSMHDTVPIEELLTRPMSASPEAEEAISLALGELLIPHTLREAWWEEPAGTTTWTPSLVIASNVLGGLATGLFGLHGRAGRVERLIEKATLRWAPTASIVQVAAAHPVYYADRYPIGLACIDPDDSLPYAAQAQGEFEIALYHSRRSAGSAPATRANLVRGLTAIGPSAPKVFFYTGHSDAGIAGVDAALRLRDGDLTAEDLLFGLGDQPPPGIPSRVLFSSCNSSGSLGAGRGEWLGLAAACLLRGARHVVGTAWPILDHPVTLRFEEELLDSLVGGADPATALRACQLRRLASWRASDHLFRPDSRRLVPDNLEIPLIWASFQSSGVY
jgi:hypothetical protein